MENIMHIYTIKLSNNLSSISEEVQDVAMENIDDFTGVVTLVDGSFVERDKLCLKDAHTAYIAFEGKYSSNQEILRKREHCQCCNNSEDFERNIIFAVLRNFLTSTLVGRLKYLNEQTECPCGK